MSRTCQRTWSDRSEAAADNAESRGARIRHYAAMYEQGRDLFTGVVLAERHRRLDRGRRKFQLEAYTVKP